MNLFDHDPEFQNPEADELLRRLRFDLETDRLENDEPDWLLLSEVERWAEAKLAEIVRGVK